MTNHPTKASVNLIAPFWDNLNPYSRVYYFYDTNEEQFIVQYQNAERFGTGEYTFEVILKPDGSIIFQYETLDGVLDSSTIGIENVDGSKGVQVSYNDGYPRSGLAVSIAPTPRPHVVSVSEDQSVEEIDFGNISFEPALISGLVWEDLNEDGIRNNDEPVFERITIYLDLDESGDLSAGDLETLTNAEGHYEFSIDSGIYDIRSITPETHVQTTPSGEYYDDVVLPGGGVINGMDFGYAPGQPGSISGHKWQDLDGNTSRGRSGQLDFSRKSEPECLRN